jgi:hypothetical protein
MLAPSFLVSFSFLENLSILEFDTVYTQKGHGRQLRENNTKLTQRDENADLELHERIVFCHILDMRENMEKKRLTEDSSKEISASETVSIKERIHPLRKVGRPIGSTKVPPKMKQIKKSPKFRDSGEQFRKNLNYLERTELTGYKQNFTVSQSDEDGAMPLRRSRRISQHQPENLEKMKRFESHGKIIYHEEAEDSEGDEIKVTNQPLLTETEDEEEEEEEQEP